MPEKRKRRRRRIITVIFAAAFLYLYLPWPRSLPVSPETTVITEPLHADGTVNYVAWLDRELARGVTAENNAALPLLLAGGPELLPVDTRAEILSRLELDLPAAGDYLEPFFEYVAPDPRPENWPTDESELIQQFDAAVRDPWSESDYPLVAAWLADQAAALELMTIASRRPRFYLPQVSPSDPPRLLDRGYLKLVPLRGLSTALAGRAQQRIGNGKLAAAWEDIMALHLLARLVNQGGGMLPGMIAVSLEGLAFDCAIDLADGDLPAAAAAAMLAELDGLPPLLDLVLTYDRYERFGMLDVCNWMYREGVVGRLRLDAGIAMRRVNWWHDRMLLGLQRETYAEQAEYFNRLGREKKERPGTFRLVLWWLGGRLTRHRVTEELTDMFCSIGSVNESLCRTRARSETLLEEERAALALAAYRARHGRYPAALADLAPEFLARPPRDRFSGQPLIYRLTEPGCCLNSVGPDGRDDDGAGDDLPVRLGGPPAPAGSVR